MRNYEGGAGVIVVRCDGDAAKGRKMVVKEKVKLYCVEGQISSQN